jgi:plastocyanin
MDRPLARRTRPLLALTATAVLALATACSGGSESPKAASGPSVELKLLAFSPAELRVPAGSTVTWRNGEAITHTVTSGAVRGVDAGTGLRTGQDPDGRFDHRLSTKGATFSHRFTDPGTYSYFCSIHQGMNASVVVTA